jgi:hypothetical protein
MQFSAEMVDASRQNVLRRVLSVEEAFHTYMHMEKSMHQSALAGEEAMESYRVLNREAEEASEWMEETDRLSESAHEIVSFVIRVCAALPVRKSVRALADRLYCDEEWLSAN